MKRLFGILHKRVCVHLKEMQWHIMSKSMLYNRRQTSSALLISAYCVPVSCAQASTFSAPLLRYFTCLLSFDSIDSSSSYHRCHNGCVPLSTKGKEINKKDPFQLYAINFSRLQQTRQTLQILFFVLHNVMLYFVRVKVFPDIIFILIFLIKFLAFVYIGLQ